MSCTLQINQSLVGCSYDSSLPFALCSSLLFVLCSFMVSSSLMNQNYPEQMNRTGRPVSPHPTIYAFHITALSSITNRVTGCALTFGAAGVASLAGPAVATVAKFSVAFPCVYHYLGAVRHLVWDRFSDMLTNVDVVMASYALVGVVFWRVLGLLLFE